MQHSTWRAGQPLVCTALCALLPAALWGCSPDLALGDVSEQEQAIDQAPAAALGAEATGQAGATGLAETSPAPRPDFTLAPELPAPDVTMRLDVSGGDNVMATGVGDLDGDGFADFATEGRDPIHATEFVHIRYGGPRAASEEGPFALEQSGARLIVGPFTDRMLAAIVPVGDVDGDGFDDMLIGLGRCDAAQAGEGAYLLYGGPERLNGALRFDEVGVLLRSPREPDPAPEFTSCYVESDPYVAALGDFDGDGLDDFLLSEWQLGDVTDPSKAYLFYGSTTRLSNGASWLDADAVFLAPIGSVPAGIGDVNADGTGDLLLSTFAGDDQGSIFIPGRGTRLQGDVDAASSGTNIGTLYPFTGTGLLSVSPGPALNPILLSPPDVDGDGVADLVLWSGGDARLFYGQPGLFATGVDVSQSVLLETAERSADLWFAGDRDGDGDADLVARFYDDVTFFSDVAFSSGSQERASGNLSFPIQAVVQANPDAFLFETDRYLERITLAGDLDGDGTSDLLTTSLLFMPDDYAAPRDGAPGAFGEPELHIHYGVPGNATPNPPVR